jgi:uncharacterized protein (DUF952 family)
MSFMLYKIVNKVKWNALITPGAKIFHGFDNDLTDGFIHMSTAEQLYSTFLKKYNTSGKHEYNVLGIDVHTLTGVQ